MSQFLMPSLGADMEAGVLVEMLKKPGEDVRRGDIIAAVETQKGVIEIEVFEDGTLAKWLVDVGAEVPVGTPLAEVEGAGDEDEPDAPVELPQTPETSPEPLPEEIPQQEEVHPTQPPLEEPQPPEHLHNHTRTRITPAARRQAAQSGIDLSNIGATPDQVFNLAALANISKPIAANPLSDMRRAIGAAMSRSKRDIPHYYLSQTLDLAAAQAFLTSRNASHPPETRLLIVALYAKAVAKAAMKFNEFNGHFENGSFAASEDVHLGLAINLRGGGLVAPALHKAQSQNLDVLMAAIRDLVSRVKDGRFRARELSDPTLTLTSLGDRGVDAIYGVIFPPQVAIVGIGTPVLMPMIHNNEVVPRMGAMATLSADHRVSDGHRGALFLRAINANLQTPEQL